MITHILYVGKNMYVFFFICVCVYVCESVNTSKHGHIPVLYIQTVDTLQKVDGPLLGNMQMVANNGCLHLGLCWKLVDR